MTETGPVTSLPAPPAPHPVPPLVALVAGATHALAADSQGVVAGPVPLADLAALTAQVEAQRAPRWVWWSAGAVRPALGTAVEPVAVARCWDLAEAHRLLAGGWTATPEVVWAAAHGLGLDDLPSAPTDDLFALVAEGPAQDPASLLTPGGYLRPDAAEWVGADADRLLAYARAALAVQQRQQAGLAARSPRATATTTSESIAAVLAVELERDGLPIDRAAAEALLTEAAGPRPADEADAARARRERDAPVLALVPGREHTDLRNPLQVKEMLASIGIPVADTRKWTLQPLRGAHPVVDALLEWRRAERIATTYGWHWLDTSVGADDRLRGPWTSCDGGAGRMTAGAGLHNLPIELRPLVAAHPGHMLVRADLGQIEPRVLAAVSGDPAFAEATRADDLYSPVAERLGVERKVAKVAVLAAMYGQTSGAAGETLTQLERAYPTAMRLLDRAYDDGANGRAVQTYGGRRVPVGRPATTPAERAGKGRYARNAVIQGSAAELFKAWAATVRALGRPLGVEVVLCLHDELLLHVPEEHAQATVDLVARCLDDSARRYTGGQAVRFVTDTSVVHRWSEAKD